MSTPSTGPHVPPSELGFPWDAGSAVHHPPALRAWSLTNVRITLTGRRQGTLRDYATPAISATCTHTGSYQRHQVLSILVDNRASSARLSPLSAGLELESPKVARVVVTDQTALAIDEVPLCVLAHRAIELGVK